MNSLVIDCSLAVHWFFEDEFDLEADSIYAALRGGKVRVHVPSLFFPEVANTLLVGERRGRCQAGKPEEFIQILLATSICIDEQNLSMSVLRVYDIAKRHGLTAYDASYLELALRLNASLSTRDNDLRQAAETAGLSIVQSLAQEP